ncbi:MAG: hypothetical protein SCH39_05690 [Methanosarcinales archaeon]|nr:hypothetical protein [Methanosarcinales archaeon]
MDAKLWVLLVIGFSATLVILGLNFTVDMISLGSGALITLVPVIAFIIILLWPANPLKKDSTNNTEETGVDTEATTDSRICEKTTSFIGVPFFLVFGGVWGKYESIFSVKHEGANIMVICPGICLVSKNDTLKILGKWYNGKKVGIEGNIVMARRIENLSSGMVFNTEK